MPALDEMLGLGLVADGRPYTVAIKALGDNGQTARALEVLEVCLVSHSSPSLRTMPRCLGFAAVSCACACVRTRYCVSIYLVGGVCVWVVRGRVVVLRPPTPHQCSSGSKRVGTGHARSQVVDHERPSHTLHNKLLGVSYHLEFHALRELLATPRIARSTQNSAKNTITLQTRQKHTHTNAHQDKE